MVSHPCCFFRRCGKNLAPHWLSVMQRDSRAFRWKYWMTTILTVSYLFTIYHVLSHFDGLKDDPSPANQTVRDGYRIGSSIKPSSNYRRCWKNLYRVGYSQYSRKELLCHCCFPLGDSGSNCRYNWILSAITVFGR
ncbi:hypothetical protein AVEN_93335-1 [Araneus ventricosus]|uniref:Uncharacterized protein n=1 Tax=Araneus ventricosus TaxID=182803 RepID=A0A4Y2NGR2_ARAVE|nr:hypothetical protein AVEN_93335-1 [Araneus ventricosus]